MCGIAGFWNLQADEAEQAMYSRIATMTNSVLQSGLDSGDVWLSPQNGLALGHRRLTTRDFPSAQRQPMTTADDRYVLCYDGVVYNHEILRAELEARGVTFRGHSDAETLLYGCALLGVEQTISRLNGIFVFAFWDAQKTRLSLVRDRFGAKPLFYAHKNGTLLFASELKTLYQHPAWSARIHRDSVTQFLRYGYIHGPNTIFEGVQKLSPGSMVHVHSDGVLCPHVYWDVRAKILECQETAFLDNPKELTEATHSLLKDVVKQCMVSEAPPGAFLSGGIDSSLVAALMQTQSTQRIRTFSIGFAETHYNEAPFAKAIAKHLGTDHTELYMQPKDAWDIIPRLADILDEPLGDSSLLPTYLLACLTRRQVTTALSGDGGDEVFAGYGRYFVFPDLPDTTPPLWKIAAWGIRHVPLPLLEFLGKCAPLRYRQNFVERLTRRIRCHCVDKLARYKMTSLTHWAAPEELIIGGKEPSDILDDRHFLNKIRCFIGQMQAVDTLSYLPDDILVKVDRTSVAASLETRIPLLDHRVFELAWRLPLSMKTQNGVGKLVLRNILAQYIPRSLFERPKMGFGVPIDIWLRGPLREWAEDLLDEGRMFREGLLNPAPVLSAWRRHLAGDDFAYPLWNVLMLLTFLRNLPAKP
jgi:asparagine synthase (glutamine-hydrolysing)